MPPTVSYLGNETTITNHRWNKNSSTFLSPASPGPAPHAGRYCQHVQLQVYFTDHKVSGTKHGSPIIILHPDTHRGTAESFLTATGKSSPSQTAVEQGRMVSPRLLAGGNSSLALRKAAACGTAG